MNEHEPINALRSFVRTLPDSSLFASEDMQDISFAIMLTHRKCKLIQLYDVLRFRPLPLNPAQKSPVNHYQTNTQSIIKPVTPYVPPDRGVHTRVYVRKNEGGGGGGIKTG